MNNGTLDISSVGEDLREAVVEIARMVRSEGGRALMVGGAVRDILAGAANVKDVDVEVFGVEPERLKSVLSRRFDFDPCGVSFGVLKIKHLDIDVSLPRRETKRGTDRKSVV